MNLNTSVITAMLIGATKMEFDSVCIIKAHVYTPASDQDGDAVKGASYQCLEMERPCYDALRLPGHPVQCELTCRVVTGSKNQLKLVVTAVKPVVDPAARKAG